MKVERESKENEVKHAQMIINVRRERNSRQTNTNAIRITSERENVRISLRDSYKHYYLFPSLPLSLSPTHSVHVVREMISSSLLFLCVPKRATIQDDDSLSWYHNGEQMIFSGSSSLSHSHSLLLTFASFARSSRLFSLCLYFAAWFNSLTRLKYSAHRHTLAHITYTCTLNKASGYGYGCCVWFVQYLPVFTESEDTSSVEKRRFSRFLLLYSYVLIENRLARFISSLSLSLSLSYFHFCVAQDR